MRWLDFGRKYHPRDLPRRQTAVLVIFLDVFTLAVIGLTAFTSVGGGPLHLGDLSLVLFVGALLIAARLVLLLVATRVFKEFVLIAAKLFPVAADSVDRLFEEIDASADGSGSLQDDSWKEAIAKVRRAATDAGNQSLANKQWRFAAIITIGIVGLAAAVLATGGPFGSPFGVILVAEFALGQVRAPTTTGLWTLFWGVITMVVALDISQVQLLHHLGTIADRSATKKIARGAPDAASEPSQSYVLAFITVAAITSYVNRATLFRRIPRAALSGAQVRREVEPLSVNSVQSFLMDSSLMRSAMEDAADAGMHVVDTGDDDSLQELVDLASELKIDDIQELQRNLFTSALVRRRFFAALAVPFAPEDQALSRAFLALLLLLRSRPELLADDYLVVARGYASSTVRALREAARPVF